MSQQVPDYYAHVSTRLSYVLDKVGYSLADRDRKVRLAKEAEVFLSLTSSFGQPLKQSIPYLCGSRSEGSTGPGLYSDIDVLVINDLHNVVKDYSGCQKNKINYVIVQDVHTPPGYVKLQRVGTLPADEFGSLHHTGYLSHSRDAGVTLNTDNVDNIWSVQNHMFSGINQAITGLSMNYRHPMNLYSADWVHAFRCFDWPTEGFECFSRHRHHSWPSTQQIENARKYGCFITPIGHSSSAERHLEWRLSFSLAERELTRSFEDTVMKVYVLLKMVKKTFIEPHLGSAFSSYHCKVCMLWMREQLPPELWHTENLLYCLTLCIERLLEWVSSGYCPDYFLVENNIYDTTLFGATRFKLLMILQSLLSQDCRYLLAIECCDIGHLLAGSLLQMDSRWPLVEEIFVDYEIFIGAAYVCRTLMMSIPIQKRVNFALRLWHALPQTHCFIQVPLCYILITIFEKMGFLIASICKANKEKYSQETIIRFVNLASKLLSFAINSDATSVRLKLCAMGIVLENYGPTETCLQYISDHCMRYIDSCTGFEFIGSRVLNCGLISFMGNTEVSSSLKLLQRYSSYVVIYEPSEIYISPVPFRMEMFRSLATPPVVEHVWNDWAVVDSRLCLHFLKFLNFSKQGKVQDKQVELDRMMHAIGTKSDIRHRTIALNLLGYCFILENKPQKAFLYFAQSLKLIPNYNAAKFYMGILFRKAIATRT